MFDDETIADACPGCGTPLVGGAIISALLEGGERYERVFGLMPGVTLNDCDAVYIGDVVINGWLPCPRCGTNCLIPFTLPPPRADRGDDRDFNEELVLDLELSVGARSRINKAGAKTVRELLRLSTEALRLAADGDRETQVAEISEFLALRGVSLKDER